MEKILKICKKLKQYKNVNLALEAVGQDILDFLDVDRFVVLKKEVQEQTNIAHLNFFHLSTRDETSSTYFKNSFPKSYVVGDYISLYSESLVSKTPIAFNSKLLNPILDEKLYKLYADTDVESCLVLPLILHNEIWGIFVLHDIRRTRDLSKEILTEAELVAEALLGLIFYSEIENDSTLKTIDDHSLRMATLGKLASSIAHEINNQIFLIGGFATKIEKYFKKNPQFQSKELVSSIASIQKACNRSNEIIEALSVTSRSAKYEQLEVCDLKYLIENLKSLSKEKLNKEKINLDVKMNEAEYLIECKPGQVMQVLTNLINNSIDALEKSTSLKKIEIKVNKKDDLVIITFSDSGKRPSDEIIVNMMEPFFTTKSLGRGSGLGLSISKQIMRKFRGDIEIDKSCENTTFNLTFPLISFEENIE